MLPFLPLATAQGAYHHHLNLTCIIWLQHKAHHLYAKMDPSRKPLNSSLNYLLHHCDCSISATHFLVCAIFMISISACLNKLLLIISPWLSPFYIFFNSFFYLSTIATTLFILYQEDFLPSRASRMTFPIEILLIWRHFFISGSSCKILCYLEWSTLFLVSTEKVVHKSSFQQPCHLPH